MQQLAGSSPNNPSDMLGYLRGLSSSVQNDGPATVDGTATTHYTATVDLDKVAKAESLSQAATQQMEQLLGGNSMTVQLWVDAQGRVRELGFNQKFDPSAAFGAAGSWGGQAGPITATMTMKLSDFGVPVTVTAPPASDTTDLTSMFGNG
jgi:hypothetical protein